MKTNIFITLLLVVFSAVSLQAKEFLVLSTYGNVTKKNLSDKNWTIVKTGSELSSSDEINLVPRSYICLYHNNGMTIEITKEGKHSIGSFLEKINNKPKPTFDVIGHYIFKQIFEADNNLIKDSKTGTLSLSVGGVERAIDVNGKDSSKLKKLKKIMVKPPSHVFTFDKQIEFSWRPYLNKKKYTFTILDPSNDIIYSSTTNETKIKVDLERLNLDKDLCYFWMVTSNSYSSDSFCLYVFNEVDESSIRDSVQAIESQFDEGNSSIKELALAVFYATKKIDNRAIEHFEKSLKLAPGSIEFRKIYALYLAKMGFKEESERVLNYKY